MRLIIVSNRGGAELLKQTHSTRLVVTMSVTARTSDLLSLRVKQGTPRPWSSSA